MFSKVDLCQQAGVSRLTISSKEQDDNMTKKKMTLFEPNLGQTHKTKITGQLKRKILLCWQIY